MSRQKKDYKEISREHRRDALTNLCFLLMKLGAIGHPRLNYSEMYRYINLNFRAVNPTQNSNSEI